MNNMCEDIRTYLKKLAMQGGADFTVKQLGMQMGLLGKHQVGDKTDSRTETKISDELRRLLHGPDNVRPNTADTSKHAHMARQMGFRVERVSYKSRNSSGGKRPAILWRVSKERNGTLESFACEEISLQVPITKEVVLQALNTSMFTGDEIIQLGINRRIKEAA